MSATRFLCKHRLTLVPLPIATDEGLSSRLEERPAYNITRSSFFFVHIFFSTFSMESIDMMGYKWQYNHLIIWDGYRTELDRTVCQQLCFLLPFPLSSMWWIVKFWLPGRVHILVSLDCHLSCILLKQSIGLMNHSTVVHHCHPNSWRKSNDDGQVVVIGKNQDPSSTTDRQTSRRSSSSFCDCVSTVRAHLTMSDKRRACRRDRYLTTTTTTSSLDRSTSSSSHEIGRETRSVRDVQDNPRSL